MTREEAITILNMVEAHGSLVIQAKDMAIKALEQEPSGDAISREDANKFLYERIERLNDDELYDIFSKIIDDMYNELPSVNPQKWIPVSERLPEKTGMCLTSFGDLVTSKSFDGYYFRTESSEVRFVPDAWMPLPPCYEPQESEESR